MKKIFKNQWENETITVEELINSLSLFPKDMPLVSEFEGSYHSISKDCAKIIHEHKGTIESFIVLDVD